MQKKESEAGAFVFETRIRFIDTDASGRIHYTCLFRYFEAAEIEFFRTMGFRTFREDVSFPRVHVECDYRLALLYDDLIQIEVRLTKVGGSSVRLEFRVRGDGLHGPEDAGCGGDTGGVAGETTGQGSGCLIPVPPVLSQHAHSCKGSGLMQSRCFRGGMLVNFTLAKLQCCRQNCANSPWMQWERRSSKR